MLGDPQLHDAERVEHRDERAELLLEVGHERDAEAGIERRPLVRRGAQGVQQLFLRGVQRATLDCHVPTVRTGYDSALACCGRRCAPASV